MSVVGVTAQVISMQSCTSLSRPVFLRAPQNWCPPKCELPLELAEAVSSACRRAMRLSGARGLLGREGTLVLRIAPVARQASSTCASQALSTPHSHPHSFKAKLHKQMCCRQRQNEQQQQQQTCGLCCAVLCCAVLCCAVLCCAVLCCAVLCCAAQRHVRHCYYTVNHSLSTVTL